jgi:peptidoglycan L-alanyl-D-glutamate endopeptidase CwlK
MSKFKYGNKSIERMRGVNTLLVETAKLALSMSEDLDWGVGPFGGLRTSGQQAKLFAQKRSKADGTNKKSYHQSGNALDLVPVINGKMTWENSEAFLTIKYFMIVAWKTLKKQKKVPEDSYLHWGGYWGKNAKDKDGDGKQGANEIGWDAPHFEIRGYRQKINFERSWDI